MLSETHNEPQGRMLASPLTTVVVECNYQSTMRLIVRHAEVETANASQCCIVGETKLRNVKIGGSSEDLGITV